MDFPHFFRCTAGSSMIYGLIRAWHWLQYVPTPLETLRIRGRGPTSLRQSHGPSCREGRIQALLGGYLEFEVVHFLKIVKCFNRRT